MKMKSYYDQIREAMENQIYHYVMENGQNGEDDDPSDRPLRTDEGESEGQEAETEQQEELL